MIHIIKKSGKFFKLMIIIFALFLIQFVYAGTVRIVSPTTSQNYSVDVNVNSTCNVNINDSIYWQGHTGTDGSWLTGISGGNSSFNQTFTDNFYVQYIGAISNVDLGSYNLNASNVTGFFGIFKKLYDYNNILVMDLNSHLLYDLATKLSIDFNDRKLYASDGTDVILDWNTIGVADFGNSNITTTRNIISPSYCNSTNCYNVTAFLKDDVGGTDSWSGNYTDYYNKIQVDNNLTLYYLKTEIDNNFTLYLPLTGGTLSGNLTLPSINLTTNYVCNSTNCYTITW